MYFCSHKNNIDTSPYMLQTRVEHNIAHVSNLSIAYSESTCTKQNIAYAIIDFHDLKRNCTSKMDGLYANHFISS